MRARPHVFKMWFDVARHVGTHIGKSRNARLGTKRAHVQTRPDTMLLLLMVLLRFVLMLLKSAATVKSVVVDTVAVGMVGAALIGGRVLGHVGGVRGGGGIVKLGVDSAAISGDLAVMLFRSCGSPPLSSASLDANRQIANRMKFIFFFLFSQLNYFLSSLF